MVQYVFTPWRDRRELLAVRRQLYPDKFQPEDVPLGPQHAAAQRAAVARVAVWMQRGHCPHMVESTALLVAALLSEGGPLDHHESAVTAPGPAAAYAARAAYAAAFARFVTGLLDGHQDRARKLSMYGLARSVGLPAAFVELRHQATHEQLPSLGRLRAAARRALAWIWQYYWANVGPDPAAADAEGEEADEAGTRSAVARNSNGHGSGEDAACRTALVQYIDETADAAAAAVGEADIAPFVARWGETRVLETLAAIGGGIGDDGEDEQDGHDQNTSNESTSYKRAIRCIRLSQLLLRKRSQQAGHKLKGKAKPKSKANKRPHAATAERWTMENLDLDAMRDALAQERIELYRLQDDGDEEGEEAANEGQEQDEDEDGADEEGAREEEEGSNDVVMAETEPEPEPEPEPEWPAPRPRWTRYEGDWKPRPIGVV